jgi:uncharacterized membrane protein
VSYSVGVRTSYGIDVKGQLESSRPWIPGISDVILYFTAFCISMDCRVCCVKPHFLNN